MMSKAKSGAGRKIRALALVPMCALAIGVASVPSVRAAVSVISSSALTISKDSKNQADYPKVRLFKFKSLSNDGDVTTVRIKGEDLGNKLTVSGGTFTTKGKTYQAKSLQCNMSDGVAIITATFPFISEFDNTSMSLTVDGKEIDFDLESYFDKSRPVEISNNSDNISPKGECFVFKGKDSSVPTGYTVFLDGRELQPSEYGSIPTDKIENVNIDSDRLAVMIDTRK